MYELFDLKEAIRFGDCSQLLYVSPFKFERDWNGMRHSHECTEIFFCIGGKGSFAIEKEVFSVSPHDFIIVNPGIEHSESSTSASPLEYVVLGLSDISFLPENDSDGFVMGNFKEYAFSIQPLLAALIAEVDRQQERYAEASSNILNLLLIYLHRVSDLKISSQKTQLPTVPARRSSEWIRQYLDDNFTKEVNLELLAQKFHLSKYTIIHNFRKFYGTTPINYILDRRFREATFLLATTENTIRQISEALGFSSYNYFTQCFQKRFSMTPSQYRKKCRCDSPYRENELSY